MFRPWRTLALAGVLLAGCDWSQSQAQIVVSGGRTIGLDPPSPYVTRSTTVIRRRRPWRERNPYYAARPVYPPAAPGARANVTFEPFTSKYYPTVNSYYPPVDPAPAVRP